MDELQLPERFKKRLINSEHVQATSFKESMDEVFKIYHSYDRKISEDPDPKIIVPNDPELPSKRVKKEPSQMVESSSNSTEEQTNAVNLNRKVKEEPIDEIGLPYVKDDKKPVILECLKDYTKYAISDFKAINPFETTENIHKLFYEVCESEDIEGIDYPANWHQIDLNLWNQNLKLFFYFYIVKKKSSVLTSVKLETLEDLAIGDLYTNFLDACNRI